VSLKAIYGKVKSTLDKDHISNTMSGVALFISILVAIYTYLQFNVDEGTEKYEFWKHINSSLKEQNGTVKKLFPLLFNESARGQKILGEIHGGTIKCRTYKTYSVGSIKNESFTTLITNNNRDERYENNEIYGYRSTVLENNYLARAININGWNKFINEKNFSDHWWVMLAWDSMHIGLFPTTWAWQCASGSNTIKVSAASLNTFKSSIATVSRDDGDIEVGIVPNIMALQNLEAENMPNKEVEYKSIKSYFKNIEITNIEKTIDEDVAQGQKKSKSDKVK
jgi:hypothetical protein